jgi:hypothetical protein
MYRYYPVTRLYKSHTFIFTKHYEHKGYVPESEGFPTSRQTESFLQPICKTTRVASFRNDIAITLDVFLAGGCHKPVLFIAVSKG